jgi:hypothetical protein
MKISKTLLSAMAAAGLVGTASATTVDVYIAGSTAYRGAVTKAIEDVLSSNAGGTALGTYNVYEAASGSPQYGASQAIISGTLSDGNNYVVHTDWTGSAAGTSDVSTGRLLPFLPDTTATNALTYNGTSGYTGEAIVSSTSTPSVACTAAMSDSFANSVKSSIATAGAQTSGVVTSSSAGSVFATAIATAVLKPAGTGSTVSGNADRVGFLPFVWVAGVQSSSYNSGVAPFTNMTQEAAATLIDNGYLPLANLGIASDNTDYAFLIGRNEDSGTRICAQAEAQADSYKGGFSFGQTMKQYYLTFTAGAGSVQVDGSFPNDNTDSNGNLLPDNGQVEDGGTGTTVYDFGLWPSDAPLNTQVYLNWGTTGHSGQIGGGDVAKVLSSTNPVAGLTGTSLDGGNLLPDGYTSGSSLAYFVGYLGIADATGVPGITAQLSGSAVQSGSGTMLSYNGVPYSATNVLNGTYSFWSYEHMYYASAGPNATTDSNKLKIINDVANELFNRDAQTDSSGNTDTAFPPTAPKNAGILASHSPAYKRSAEGALIQPTN